LYPQLIELEPDLHHALKSVFSFDVISLSGKPEQRTLYLEALSVGVAAASASVSPCPEG
jgi:hypothetical protein